MPLSLHFTKMRITLLATIFLSTITSYAQSELTSGYFNYHISDRFEIMSDSLPSRLFSTVKPYRRDVLSNFVQSTGTRSKADDFNKSYLLNDNFLYNDADNLLREKPILSHFYKTQSALLVVQEDNFNMMLNSSDNAVLGMDWKWNFMNRFSFYGQFILDEFIKDEMFGHTQSWVNKWGYQAGIKYINVANINNLGLQLEVNQLRPYVYQHRSKSQNWAHYNQSLAHPLGTNMREFMAIARYQPTNRLNVNAIYSTSKQGIDTAATGINYDGDYLRTYGNRPAGSNPMFQGIENNISNLSLDVSYMLWHNLFLDAGIHIRNQNNALLAADKESTIFRFGMRLNIAALDYRL